MFDNGLSGCCLMNDNKGSPEFSFFDLFSQTEKKSGRAFACICVSTFLTPSRRSKKGRWLTVDVVVASVASVVTVRGRLKRGFCRRFRICCRLATVGRRLRPVRPPVRGGGASSWKQEVAPTRWRMERAEGGQGLRLRVQSASAA